MNLSLRSRHRCLKRRREPVVDQQNLSQADIKTDPSDAINTYLIESARNNGEKENQRHTTIIVTLSMQCIFIDDDTDERRLVWRENETLPWRDHFH